jgi:hypothetical protein
MPHTACPHCGGGPVGKIRGLQGLGEVLAALVLTACGVLPGIVYYVWQEAIPYCTGCGRRAPRA